MPRPSSSIPFTADGWIEARKIRVSALTPQAAWEEILDQTANLTEEDRRMARTATRAERPPGAYKAGFHISPGLHVVAIQGGWWYRGVTAVEPEKDGSKITYVVVNVAPGWSRWVAHLFQARSHRK